jgi:hypothetical protein
MSWDLRFMLRSECRVLLTILLFAASKHSLSEEFLQ